MVITNFERELFTGVIYCYTNKINGKKYVGQTINETERKNRFRCIGEYSGLKINNARKKYGTTANWDYNIIIKKQYLNEEDASVDLNLLEMYFIEKYDSYKQGYNSTYGADSVLGNKMSDEVKERIRIAMTGEKNPFFGKHHTEETKKKIRDKNLGRHPSEDERRKMSEKRKGRKVSEEIKMKISATRKQRYKKGKTHYNFGMKLTDEQKRKISKSKIGKPRKDLMRVIQQIDLITGKVIKEWSSIKEAAQSLNLNAPNIINVCKGIYKHSGGFGWRYKEGN